MSWILQGRPELLTSLLRLPRSIQSRSSRDGDNSGLEQNQVVDAHSISNVGQQPITRRNTISSERLEEIERERIRRIQTSTRRNDLEEGGGGLPARSPEPASTELTRILRRDGDGYTGLLGIDENGHEHLNVTIDPIGFLKDAFAGLLLLSVNIFIRNYLEIIHLGSAIFLLYLVDRTLRARVAEPTRVSKATCIAMAVLAIVYVLSSMHMVGTTLGLRQVWWRFLFLPLEGGDTEHVQSKALGGTIWLACMLDCWAKHAIFAVKALVAASSFVSPNREFRNEAKALSQKRKLFAIIEAIGRCYRTLLPCPGWLEYYSPNAYLRSGKHAIAYNLSIFSVVYLTIKGVNFFFRCRSVLNGIWFHCKGVAEFGQMATDDDMSTSSDCSICHEIIRKPAIVLDCSHIFCEDCLQEWLDRESTCPLCRSRTHSHTPIPTTYRDGHTSLFPFFW